MEQNIYVKKAEQVYDETKIREAYSVLTKLLIEKQMTITTMESATSGQIASLLTDTEGASAIFKGAYITYCNEAKVMQGVPEEVIKRFSVYSRETAIAMAEACVQSYGADIGIGVTGNMGNVDPANADVSVPGRIFFAIHIFDTIDVYEVEIAPQPSRLAYKLAVAKEVCDELMKKLTHKN